MDDILTEFITETSAEPALAHDLLEAASWNLQSALDLYSRLMGTRPPQPHPHSHSQNQPQDQHSSDVYLAPLSPSEEHDDGDKEGGEKYDTLRALEGSFEIRKKALRRKKDIRNARGLSFLAEDVVDKFHQVAISKYRVSSQEQTVIDDQFFRHSFVYPDFSSQPEDLQRFIASDLMDVSIKVSLEKNMRLNWWSHTGKFPQLEPLSTSGDGNCLLHAASLYMWGFHDRFLILRTSMHRLLTQSREKAGILSRWHYQTQLRNDEAGGLTFSEEEWDFEWSEVVRIATNKPRCELNTATLQRHGSLRLSYEYLEEVHIFALAHVTQRPIIVIADTTLKGVSGEDIAPIYFGGIYLPLEINPTACHKSPVVLAYDSAHFSALVAKEPPPSKVSQGRSSRKLEEPVIPLVGPDGSLLPIQFVYDPAKPAVSEYWGKMKYKPGEFPTELIGMLESYLSIRWIELPIVSESAPPASTPQSDNSSQAHQLKKLRCPAAHMAQKSQPIYQKELIENYLKNVQERFEEEQERQRRVAEDRLRAEEEKRLRKPVPCRGEGCSMFGTAGTNGLCSLCFQQSAVQQDQDQDNDEIEKVDLSLQNNRELDPEIVENYIPRIQGERPPSYTEATGGRDEGVTEEKEDRGNSSMNDSDSSLQANGESSSLSKLSSPSKLNRESCSEEVESSSSSSIDGSSKANIEKSPKKHKGWVKKLQALPTGFLNGSKAKKVSSGYSRDSIQPISFSKTSSAGSVGGGTRTQCVSAGCEFFGSPSTDGYCSSCFKQTHSPVA